MEQRVRASGEDSRESPGAMLTTCPVIILGPDIAPASEVSRAEGVSSAGKRCVVAEGEGRPAAAILVLPLHPSTTLATNRLIAISTG